MDFNSLIYFQAPGGWIHHLLQQLSLSGTSIVCEKRNHRYMYLKTYAKFTFCIKPQGHNSDENLLYYCMDLASRILPTVSEIYETNRLTLFIVKVFKFFRYVPQNIHGHFQSCFQNAYTLRSEATFAFYCIKLSH